MKAKFKGTIWRTGNTNVITIPAQYLKDEVVELDKEYTITIDEVQE